MKDKPIDNMDLEVMEAFTSMKSDQEIGMPDVEQELAQLKSKRTKRTSLSLRKWAASIAIILAISSFAIAAVHTSFFTHGWNEVQAPSNSPKGEDSNTASSPLGGTGGGLLSGTGGGLLESDIILFQDVRLDSVLMQMDEHYEVESRFADDDLRQIRLLFKWNKQLNLDDQLKRLNGFERFQIHREENQLIVEQPKAE